MKTNKELLLDIIILKKKNMTMLAEELSNSLNEEDNYIYSYELLQKKENIEFLNSLIGIVSKDSGLDYLKKYLRENHIKNTSFNRVIVSKYRIVKDIVKEYKNEYRKNYWNNKYVGLNGLFDNELFCDIIRKRIYKYTYCNKVTQVKYNHLVSFLNELLHEMEVSKNPLETLKYKIKLYQKYRKSEYIKIRRYTKPKIEILKEIIDEYKEKKKITLGCI